MISCCMASFRLGLFLVVSLLIPGWASVAHANGSYSHIHISQLAVEELPPGPIQTLLSDPLYAPMMEAGSMFPDSGYAISSPYGEEAHWPPFVRAYQEWLTEEYQGDFSSTEAKQNLAFFFGLVSHGVADQTYDFMMLTRSEEVDGPVGDVDREADYFIVIDENVQLFTQAWAPYEELPAIFTTGVGYGSNPAVNDISEATLMDGMGRMEFVIFIQRRGDFIFPIDIEIELEDHSKQRERWTLAEQQAAPEQRLKIIRLYRLKSPVHRVEVDPEQKLLLDRERLNNSLYAKPERTAPRRLWLSWLGAVQTLMDLVSL